MGAFHEAIEETHADLKATMPWAQQRSNLEDADVFIKEAVANWKALQTSERVGLPVFIWDRSGRHFLGSSGYPTIDWQVPCVEIGYWLRASAWGQGIMTEAVEALTAHAFSVFKARRLEIHCAATNLRSQKVAERCGYTLEARLQLKAFDFASGVVVDELVYARFL